MNRHERRAAAVFERRLWLQQAIERAGGEIEDCGMLMIPPYTADINFSVDGEKFSIQLKTE
jgi:hypothetical protein